MAEVLATIIGQRIAVRAPFELKDDCKAAASGARWSKSERAWTYPLTVETCHGLRATFGKRLRVLTALADWYTLAAAERAAQTTRIASADATLVRLPTAAPRLFDRLRGYQRSGASAIANAYRGSILVADKPGVGKTLEVIAGIIEADVQGPVLVVCPRLSVKRVWAKELHDWTDEPVYFARGTRGMRDRALAAFEADPSPRKWLIVVAEMLRVELTPDPEDPSGKRMQVTGFSFPKMFETLWHAVVVDESHKLFGSLTVVKGNLMGRGLKKLPMAPSALRIAVSGTPFGKGGRVQGMFGTLHWLWPDEFTSFWRWAEQNFEVTDKVINRMGQTAKQVGRLTAFDGNDEAFLQSLGPRILRRTKEEVLPDLPPKQYQEVMCEMTPKQRAQYRAMSLDAETVAPGGVISANGVLAEITRAKQMANGELKVNPDGSIAFTGDSGKLDTMMEMFEARALNEPHRHEDDLKVLVASQFNEFLEVACARLEAAGIDYHLMIGETSDRERDRLMDQFQEVGGPRVFVLNAKAGGVSVTLDAADEVHMLDEMWDPGDNEQLEDRVHRASRNHQVTIYQYRSEGTIDQEIAEDVEHKRFEQFKVLDGRRGMAYLREMTKYTPPKEF